MKVLTVVGARPQFVKAAVVGCALQAHGPAVRNVTVHTGQHYDANMSDVFFRQLGLPAPDHHLGVGGLGTAAMTGRMMERLEAVLSHERPDVVLVYGDTDSTLAGAVTAAKLRVPVAHVEAGLRSFDPAQPEEINRVVADRVSSVLYTTSDVADGHLRAEGIPPERVVQVGDVMFDACRAFAPQAAFGGITLPSKPFWVATVHRASNTDDDARLAEVVRLLVAAAARCAVVIPLHPRTRKRLAATGQLATVEAACTVVEPVGYLEMLGLLRECAGVLTDSGGLQKEAYYLGRRCAVLRDRTEWVELVEQGFATLVDPGSGWDVARLADWFAHPLPAGDVTLYGGGQASAAIAADLLRRFGA